MSNSAEVAHPGALDGGQDTGCIARQEFGRRDQLRKRGQQEVQIAGMNRRQFSRSIQGLVLVPGTA